MTTPPPTSSQSPTLNLLKSIRRRRCRADPALSGSAEPVGAGGTSRSLGSPAMRACCTVGCGSLGEVG